MLKGGQGCESGASVVESETMGEGEKSDLVR